MTRARAVIAAELGREGAMLPILHALQAAFGCIPVEADALVAEALNVSRAEVLGVISFYHDFRREPAGRHVLKLCRAEACQSRGAVPLAEALLGRLGLGWGGSSADGSLTVEAAYCLGLCACGPNALLDGAPLSRLTPERLEAALSEAS